MNLQKNSEERMDTVAPETVPAADTNDIVYADQVEDFDSDADIVFDCPHCEHQMIIDIRGAGLTVPCAGCGEEIEVPIPEGLEVTDFDESNEQLFGQVMQLRRSLMHAEGRIVELEQELAAMMEQRAAMERERVADVQRHNDIGDLLLEVLRGHDEVAVTINKIQLLLEEDQGE